MSPRYKYKDSIKRVFIGQTSLFFHFSTQQNRQHQMQNTNKFASASGLHYICGMKTLCIVLGSISLALVILGIFLPLLPTTPFLLLTAALYFKGSPRLYNWLLNHRHFGPYIRNFRENKAIPLRAKILSLTLMWGTMSYCIFFLIPLLWVKILLALIAAGVTYHILSFKTLK